MGVDDTSPLAAPSVSFNAPHARARRPATATGTVRGADESYGEPDPFHAFRARTR
jgi:hypothetical protein